MHRPNYDFDGAFYTNLYNDINISKFDPKLHYERYGRQEGRFPNRYRLAISNLGGSLTFDMQDLVVNPKLRDALCSGVHGAEELAFELISLGDPVDRIVSHFSSQHYASTYRDVSGRKVEPFDHYVRSGAKEKRATLKGIRENVHRGKATYDPNRATCLICTHEFSRTGAPLVALDIAQNASKTHNVIVMGLRSGRIMDSFLEAACYVAVVSSPNESWNYLGIEGIECIDFAILNSVETAPFVKTLVAKGIPFVSYVHEFLDYILPTHKAAFISLYSDAVLFSSVAVQSSWKGMLADVNFDISKHSEVMAQSNMTFLPSDRGDCAAARARLSKVIGVECGSRRIVYGAGHAHIRKGTDLFILLAQQFRKTDPDTLFIWIGDGTNHEDMAFGVWLDKHMREAKANTHNGNLFFIPSGSSYDDVCLAADVLFLPSRLDPLPNVVFDAARSGCTTVLFRGATGFDDSSYDNLPYLLRVDYGDLFDARNAIAKAPRKLSWRRRLKPHNAEKSHTGMNVPLFEALQNKVLPRDRIASALSDTLSPNDVSVLFRDDDPLLMAPARRNERALLARLGRRAIWPSVEAARDILRTEGGWMHAHSSIEQHFDIPIDDPRVSHLPPLHMHIHAHYLDGLEEDISSHAVYRHATRIVATTDTDAKAMQIEKFGAAHGITIDARVVPNQGRDILPFLHVVADDGCNDDAIWCHVHQKKSISSTSGGDMWRSFLIRILLGDEASIAFATARIAEPGTGLVTAFDPHIVGWTGSRRLLPEIERQLGRPLPSVPLMFPMGNMFWTRAVVARGMLDLFGSTYAWPNEPLPNDGTVYHLIERLWPAVVADMKMKSVFVNRSGTKRV